LSMRNRSGQHEVSWRSAFDSQISVAIPYYCVVRRSKRGMHHTDHNLKLVWGAMLTGIFLLLVVSFVRNAFRQQGVVYNWLGVLLSFLMVGVVIYLIFFVQM
jgi:hypothetical protein